MQPFGGLLQSKPAPSEEVEDLRIEDAPEDIPAVQMTDKEWKTFLRRLQVKMANKTK